MLEPQEKTITILPSEIMLRIFSEDCLEIKEQMVLSLVCKLWANFSSDNTVWNALFLRKFSWSPTLFYVKTSPIKQSYQQQLSLNTRLEEKCTPIHQCSYEPGLIEAIREQNIPQIEALLNSGHGIFIDPNLPLNTFFDTYLQVLSECTSLPPILIKKIFVTSVVDDDNERYVICAFHILCLKGNSTLLEKICSLIGDDLLKIVYFCDRDGDDLFWYLLKYPYCGEIPYADVQPDERENRFNLVLDTFCAVLGKLKMRSLLTTPLFLYENKHESFIHILARHITLPNANQFFFKAFSYLEKEDYWILLKEGSNYYDIPLLNLMDCPISFQQLLPFLGDDAQKFLKHENSYKENFLYILLVQRKFSHISLLEKEMGLGFMHLLVNHYENILKDMIKTQCSFIQEGIIQSLKLLNEYGYGDIIQEVYEAPEFDLVISKNSCIDDGIVEVFKEYLEEETSDFSPWSLLDSIIRTGF